METFILRLITALVAGLIIGISNRENSMIRVFALVCVGAALITIVSMEFFKFLSYPWISDPGRLAAQIVSALGFIGSGFIWITDNNKVGGLSAAAGLWITAILGILIGIGSQYVTVIVLLLVITVFGLPAEKWKK